MASERVSRHQKHRRKIRKPYARRPTSKPKTLSEQIKKKSSGVISSLANIFTKTSKWIWGRQSSNDEFEQEVTLSDHEEDRKTDPFESRREQDNHAQRPTRAESPERRPQDWSKQPTAAFESRPLNFQTPRESAPSHPSSIDDFNRLFESKRKFTPKEVMKYTQLLHANMVVDNDNDSRSVPAEPMPTYRPSTLTDSAYTRSSTRSRSLNLNGNGVSEPSTTRRKAKRTYTDRSPRANNQITNYPHTASSAYLSWGEQVQRGYAPFVQRALKRRHRGMERPAPVSSIITPKKQTPKDPAASNPATATARKILDALGTMSTPLIDNSYPSLPLPTPTPKPATKALAAKQSARGPLSKRVRTQGPPRTELTPAPAHTKVSAESIAALEFKAPKPVEIAKDNVASSTFSFSLPSHSPSDKGSQPALANVETDWTPQEVSDDVMEQVAANKAAVSRKAVREKRRRTFSSFGADQANDDAPTPKKSDAVTTVDLTSSPVESKEKPASPAPVKGLASFLPKKGSVWTCPSCDLDNEIDQSKCKACETAKPGSEESSPAPAPSASLFSFGDASTSKSDSTTTGSFGLQKSSESPSKGFSFGKTDSSPSPSTGFSFGKTDSSEKSSSGFTFGNTTTTPLATTTSSKGAADEPGDCPVCGMGMEDVDHSSCQDDSSSKDETAKDTTSTPSFSFGVSAPASSEKQDKKEDGPAFSFGGSGLTSGTSITGWSNSASTTTPTPAATSTEPKDCPVCHMSMEDVDHSDCKAEDGDGDKQSEQPSSTPSFSFGGSTSTDTKDDQPSFSFSTSSSSKDEDKPAKESSTVTSFQFGATSTTEEDKEAPAFTFSGVSGTAPLPVPSFSFGNTASKPEAESKDSSSTSTFSTENTSTPFSFGPPPSTNDDEKAASSGLLSPVTAEDKKDSQGASAPFVFGATTMGNAAETKKEDSKTPSFAFGSTPSTSSFGDSSAPTFGGAQSQPSTDAPFQFGGSSTTTPSNDTPSSAFGGNNSSSSGQSAPFSFGATPSTPSGAPSFGSFGSQDNTMSSDTMAVESPSTSAFGGSNNNNNSSSNASPFVFGGASGNNQPSTSQPSVFNAPSSGFGQDNSNSGGSNNTSAFGAPSFGSGTQPSPFGAASNSGSGAFGSNNNSNNNSAFGAPSGAFNAPSTNAPFSFGNNDPSKGGNNSSDGGAAPFQFGSSTPSAAPTFGGNNNASFGAPPAFGGSGNPSAAPGPAAAGRKIFKAKRKNRRR